MHMEVKFINATYQESETKKRQGKRSGMKRYEAQGYHIDQERQGNFILVKNVKIIAFFEKEDGEIINRNIKRDILWHYNKERCSKNLFNTFLNDAKEGRIKFYLDDYDNFSME